MLEQFNLNLFNLINASTSASEWEIRLALFAAVNLVYLVPIVLVVLWLWGTPKQRSPLLLATMVAILTLSMNYLIDLIAFQPRPEVLGVGRTLLAHAPDSSFPSDHMTLCWAIGLTLFCHTATRFVGAVTMAVGLVVAWGRIYVGVHFPLDMAGAIVVSSLCLVILMPIRPWIGLSLLPLVEKIYTVLFTIPLRWGWIR